jgi:hypothetical protein
MLGLRLEARGVRSWDMSNNCSLLSLVISYPHNYVSSTSRSFTMNGELLSVGLLRYLSRETRFRLSGG